MSLLTEILIALRPHVGRENLISAKELAREVGLDLKDGARKVRQELSDALCDGALEELEIPLCAIPGQGYFIASDYEEAQDYADFLNTLASEAARKLTRTLCLFAGVGLKVSPTTRKPNQPYES